MPKVNRNKQHIDYSNLLSELQKKSRPEENETAPSRQKLQTESKIDFSQRNSMLSNPEVQFAIVTNKNKQTLHDKTCKQLREIADEKIEFIKKFPQKKYPLCNVCQLSVCLRVGARDRDRVKTYKNFFEKTNASAELIYQMYISYGFQTRAQNETTIIVWSKEDTWKIEVKDRYGNVILWHNNYYITKAGNRKTLPEFHNQFPDEQRLKFIKAISCISTYSPAYHIEQKELKQMESDILAAIHFLQQEDKQRATKVGLILYKIRLAIHNSKYCSLSGLEQIVHGFYIVRTKKDAPCESGRYCIIYRAEAEYIYDIGILDVQRQLFRKSYNQDTIADIASVVAWRKIK